jgi:hypothetical protein
MEITSENLRIARDRVNMWPKESITLFYYGICIECEKLICLNDAPKTRYEEDLCPYCKSYDNLVDLTF